MPTSNAQAADCPCRELLLFGVEGWCCGGEGEALCIAGNNSCGTGCAAGHVETVLGTCQVPRKVGQFCGPGFPCDTNSSCVPNPWEFFGAQRCVASADVDADEIVQQFSTNICRDMYSSDLHSQIKNGYDVLGQNIIPDAVAFGVGSQPSAGVAGISEVGTVYARDGRYGCYQSLCAGVVGNVGGEFFAGITQFVDFDDINGSSYVIVGGGGEIINASVAAISPSPGLAPNAWQNTVSVGVSLLPFDVGQFFCETSVNVVISPVDSDPLDPNNQYVTFGYTGTQAGTFSRPWNNLETAISNVGSTDPIINIQGVSSSPVFINKNVQLRNIGSAPAILGQ